MKKYILVLLVSFGLSAATYAQGFTDIDAGLTGLHWSDVAWGDYDSDGDLDIIIAGLNATDEGITKIYKNEGNDTFSELTGLNLPGTFVGDIAWGDYDADGDLDILIQGYTDAAEITKMYKNTGNDNFVESGLTFPTLVDGSVSFADYNNDGYLDILIAGYDGNTYKAIVYRNNGDATYTDSGIVLPAAIKSAYEWGDYDNDSDLDIFITGLDFDGDLISKLYTNNGDETFTGTLNSFTGAWLGDAAWGDYNSDGHLDILLSGYSVTTQRIAKLYKNNGDGTFTEQTLAGLTGVSHSSTIWGDYDNDGDLDVFIGGTYEGSGEWVRVTDVFINNGNNTFTAAGLDFSADVFWGESAWGDYDSDGNLDLICCGFDDLGGSNTIIYRNDNNTPNTAPESPQNLISEVTDNEVTLNWDDATDNETPSAGLTYNAYIRNETGDIIWNSMSVLADGYRLVPTLGNAQLNISWTIKDLTNGNYFWSVQAIDNNFVGSIFSDEGSFTITTVGAEENEIQNIFLALSNYPNPFPTSTTIEYNLKYPEKITLTIYDYLGKPVYQTRDNQLHGLQMIVWNGEKFPDGIYYYRLQVGDAIANGKMVKVRK